MLTRRTQLAIKEESSEGVAESPAAADVIDVFNVQFTPGIEANRRDPVRSSLSPQPSVMGKRMATCSFEMEIKGAASAGLTAPFALPLKACGAAETLVASTSATYLPATESIPSVTISIYQDGKLKKMWGCRGTATLVFEAGKPGRIIFNFTGADWSEADAALLTGVTYSSVLPPKFQGVTLTIDSYAATISRIEIPFGNTVALRTDAASPSGHKSAVITGKEPTMTFDPEDVLAAGEDFFGNWRDGSLMALAATGIGSVAGNTAGLTAPKVQYQGLTETEREGIRAIDINALLCGNTGDDEWQLQIT